MTSAPHHSVLVVGVNGLIGRNTAKGLRDRGHEVRGVSRGAGEYRSGGAMRADLLGIDIRFGDTADQGFAKESLRDMDRVVFAAGTSGVAASIADPAASFAGSVNPWRAVVAESEPGTRLVLMSSQLVYGPSHGRPFGEEASVDPASPYALHRLQMEADGRVRAGQGAREVVALRLGNIFGDVLKLDEPRSHGLVALMLRDLVTQRVVRLLGGGIQTVNLLHVGDLASAIIRVIERPTMEPFSVFNVSGESLSVLSIAELLLEGYGSGELVSMPWTGELERASAGDVRLDDSRFRRDFGWRPQRSVATELEHLVRDWSRR
jgi:UDP-glucose 4-epimerase